MKKQINQLMLTLASPVILIALLFTSCQKDPQPQGKEITVQVKTEGLHIEQMKSFDLSTWVYNYNPNVYELKFTGSKGKIYTYQKTIQELKTGFAVSILPDSYNITYQSLHDITQYNSPLDDKLDIVINESKTITTAADLTLKANNDDYLVIMDNNCLTANIWSISPINGTNNNVPFYKSSDNTFRYMYWNKEGNITINYRDQTNEPLEKTIANATKGNVYHIVNGVNGNSGINITGMQYNMIGW